LGLFCWRHPKGISLIQLLDLGSFGLPLAQAIGRWGNFFSKELYGVPTNLPIAVTDSLGNKVHPLFLYESLLNLSLFLIFIWQVKKRQPRTGKIFAGYLIGYGIIRFLLEPLRPIMSVWTLAGYPVAQLVSLLAIGLGLRLAID
jgi:prolipoprotein diacylglyceryl transferase